MDADLPDTTPTAPVLDTISLTALRAPAVRRLLVLRTERRLTRAHVRTAAQCLDVSERTVWRWLADATTTPATAQRPGARPTDRFEITPQIRVLLAYWHGNASAVHRDLAARARAATTPPTHPERTTPTSTPPPSSKPIPQRRAPQGCPAPGPTPVAVDVPARGAS
ncbi:hypothetical protein [Streptomyces sp. Qhu_M48]|uniref:hypothetical protein n=1 Tax=Streptomyces sp. Qhu_M48 TaxID=3435889 RepID=UPI003F5006D4